ncbi:MULTISPECIES: hypothetical protein [Mammaliicoccus]|nr:MULTISPECIES: hypothetical protein [Mammaliicoccus]ARB40751.1 hypothetical protein B5728_08775 [Mammaliicoccus sciuri]MCE5041783.1 hypothetical protein [Mammaliicoccus sciuri]MCE5058867.1 hypothetical protein [Mammaliicoccus sciuri]MCE5086453.1 hypothetical protein [Mammaliicoccus sciuri]MCE5095902.1 hypothetical protein [Mammaliicoccus sciuri]
MEDVIITVEELRKTWQENINKEYLNKSPQDYLLQINEIGEEFNDDIKETSNELDEFIKIITFYLKQEWEKVKRIE